eukprot:g3640.t1
MPHYYANIPYALTRDKPDTLKCHEWRIKEFNDMYLVRNKTEGWVPRRGKGKWSFKPSELERLENDIVMLDHINEAQIVHNIRERYRKDHIYTWCGASKTVLISVNPFKMLPLYTPRVIDMHRHPPPNKTLEPHVYDIANHALRSLTLNGKDQSILISGESGAGKTECAKQCFSFLAETAGSDSNVEQLILSANPLLEAFGNAKTLRNNNSSRFGKWVAINFSPLGKIVGARAESYLLEKSRVVAPARGERSFHIFYQLFSSARHREKYGLTDPSKFRFLSKSKCYVVDGIDDQAEFEDTQGSMSKLGFTKAEQSWIFDTVAGLLHLGTIKFKAKRIAAADGSEVKTPQRLKRASKLLKVKSATLEKSITHRSIAIGGKKTMIPLKPGEALDAVDALAKAVYEKLFQWLVKRVNAATAEKASVGGGGQSSKSSDKRNRFIGVLDIFGFEIFEKNSFEQLCINYCNEKLQQFFNKHTFKEEESVYVSEGVPFTKIKFIDNQPVLDTIERKRKGLLPLLDDEVRLPKGSDENYMRRVDDINSKMEPYVVPVKARNARKSKLLFVIEHYAGTVMYSSVGFMEKNKDTLFDELSVAMSSSESKYMQELFPKERARSRKQATVSERFRKQLNDLMKLLHKTEPAYIRCIKPNHEKRSDCFVAPLCIEQLKYSGVFEAVAIRKQGYPFRLTHKRFAARYNCTLLRPDGSWKSIRAKAPQYREMCEQLLDTMKGDVSGVQMGKTKCLYRAKEHRLMDLMRHLALERVVPTCQRVIRGHLAREMKRRLLRVGKMLADAIAKGNDIKALDKAIDASTTVIGSLRTLFDFEPKLLREAVALKRDLKLWIELEDTLDKLSKIDVEKCYDELGAAVARGTELKKKKIKATSRQEQLLKDATKRIHSCAKMRIDPAAEEALYYLDRKKLVAVLKDAQEVAYESAQIKEIASLLDLSPVAFAKLQLKKAIELSDPLRRINREIFLEMHHLEANGKWFHFTKYPRLKDPTDFANSSWKP